MTTSRLDIAVAGCGPAGLAAALFLARAGHRVTIFERFAEPQPLGSGLILQPTGLAVLAQLGLYRRIAALGQRIERLFGRVCPSQRIVLDVRYAHLSPDCFGVAVHRAALFTTLHDAVVGAGVRIETNWPVGGAEPASGSRLRLLRRDGAAAGPFDLVIDALGTRTPLAPLFGASGPPAELAYGALWATVPWPAAFDPHALEQRYERASVMIGLLPIGRQDEGGRDLAAFFWSLKPREHPAWREAGLQAWKDRVARLWPQVAPILDEIRDADALTLARYAHRTLRRPAAAGAVAIGDAAHAASPQLGQGANMALLDAQALSLALQRTGDVPDAIALYARLRRRHVQLFQALSLLFTPFYQSDSRLLPVLRDRVVAPATRWRGLRRLVAASVAGTLVDPLSGA